MVVKRYNKPLSSNIISYDLCVIRNSLDLECAGEGCGMSDVCTLIRCFSEEEKNAEELII